jgi:hypothetical protein
LSFINHIVQCLQQQIITRYIINTWNVILGIKVQLNTSRACHDNLVMAFTNIVSTLHIWVSGQILFYINLEMWVNIHNIQCFGVFFQFSLLHSTQPCVQILNTLFR